jgi:hypothetical protein
MSAFVDDENLVARFGERPPDHRAAQDNPANTYVIDIAT